MTKQNITADYCYINDAMGWEDGSYAADDYCVCNAQKKCMTKKCVSATVKGLCYRDADGCSNRLYRDLLQIWGNGGVLKLRMEDSVRFNLFSNDGIRFSCDYIGPSRAWAHYIGITDKEIGEYLLKSRTIGGHILWPVHKNPTINTARAGGNSFFDRIDLTLYEIRRFYLGDNKKSKFPRSIWNILQRDIEKTYLLSFSDNQYGEPAFKTFIDSWLLQDFVMDDMNGDYRVVSLAISEENKRMPVSEDEPIFPGNDNLFSDWKDVIAGNIAEKNREVLCSAYKKYAENLLAAVEKRNRKIIDKMRKGDYLSE